ncbi:synaptosomal-associated protein 47 isoform X5 [Dromaius novaehollandiae]|uniref:synaptosomal-associated protein 47 isoform X5 n=1 Tax=Dromaius novaehollandiae TaxID=8790 RepID=UPI00311F3EB2
MDSSVKIAASERLPENVVSADRVSPSGFESIVLAEEDLNGKLMNQEIRIHSWPCSYYLDTSKQWVSGRLSLTPLAIKFTADKTGSQKRLEDTAKVLHYQGEQFDNIMRGLNKIEGDMDVADRLLTELESPSWWPFSSKLWKAPLEAKPKETATVSDSKNQEGIIIRIPVIITHRTDSNVKPGKLTLLASGLEISDCNSQVIHRFESKDVDDIRVHTPYEISVRQRFIGKPDTSYRLLSAKMPEAIPILEMQFSKKIQFLEDALGFVGARESPQVDLGTSIWQAATGLLGGVVQPSSPVGGGEGMDNEQVQLQSQEKISELETKELKQILKKLKGLALETEAELERQDEALDSITTSVDRATLNIDKQNRRIKKLT